MGPGVCLGEVRAPHPSHCFAVPGFTGCDSYWAHVGLDEILWHNRTGMGRHSENLQAKRRDLLLPEDFAGTHEYALLAISEAKTRFTAARHQTAKLDSPDLVRVVSLAFGKLDHHTLLWPFSGCEI